MKQSTFGFAISNYKLVVTPIYARKFIYFGDILLAGNTVNFKHSFIQTDVKTPDNFVFYFHAYVIKYYDMLLHL